MPDDTEPNGDAEPDRAGGPEPDGPAGDSVLQQPCILAAPAAQASDTHVWRFPPQHQIDNLIDFVRQAREIGAESKSQELSERTRLAGFARRTQWLLDDVAFHVIRDELRPDDYLTAADALEELFRLLRERAN